MSKTDNQPVIEVVARGPVEAAAKTYATDKVAVATRDLREPILGGHVVLTMHADPAATSPAVAEAVLDVNGTIVRIQTAGDTMNEAIDRLSERLSRRLHDRPWQYHRKPHRVSRAGPLEPPSLTVAEENHGRKIRRRKVASSEPLAIDEAASEIEVADVDFFMFVEESSGQPALLRRIATGALNLFVEPEIALTLSSSGHIEVVGLERPELSVDEAIDHLSAHHDRLLFFSDASSGSAGVLYRRLGGHYGLLTFGSGLD